MLRMVGVRLGGSVTIEFGKPDMGKMVLPMSPEAGLEMPAKIYVYEKGGKVYVGLLAQRYVRHRGSLWALLREVRRGPSSGKA